MSTSTLSFEFFPPKTTDGIEKLRENRAKLAKFNPEFFSVTFGAGGSTRDRTMDTVLEIQHEGYQAAPHISCVSSSKEEIRELLQLYQTQGIKRLVAPVSYTHLDVYKRQVWRSGMITLMNLFLRRS